MFTYKRLEFVDYSVCVMQRYKGKCPQLETLVELCSDAEKFTIR